MRFTKKNRQEVLNNNEGFSRHTSYRSPNFSEERTYTIKEGNLTVHAEGDTCWSDSKYDETYVYDADADETKRFLRNYKDQLTF